MVFRFVQKFFFGQNELEYLYFLSRKAQIFFSLRQDQNIFFSNIGNQNIFLEKKTLPPPLPPWKLNGSSLNNTLIYVILYVRVRNCLNKSLIQSAYADDSLYLTAKKVCLLLKPPGVVSPENSFFS